jgi:uncharacterized protein (UPF0262 family)
MSSTALPPGRSLLNVVLDGEKRGALSSLQEADLAQAVADLSVQNCFAPKDLIGPFVLHLSIVEGRLIFDVRDAMDVPLTALGLALGPFRRLIKDYQLLVDSYAHAVQDGREASIQAIDMGRRGLHNEGATLMLQRLAGRVEIDFEAAVYACLRAASENLKKGLLFCKKEAKNPYPFGSVICG